jgi:hypothetical protein
MERRVDGNCDFDPGSLFVAKNTKLRRSWVSENADDYNSLGSIDVQGIVCCSTFAPNARVTLFNTNYCREWVLDFGSGGPSWIFLYKY